MKLFIILFVVNVYSGDYLKSYIGSFFTKSKKKNYRYTNNLPEWFHTETIRNHFSVHKKVSDFCLKWAMKNIHHERTDYCQGHELEGIPFLFLPSEENHFREYLAYCKDHLHDQMSLSHKASELAYSLEPTKKGRYKYDKKLVPKGHIVSKTGVYGVTDKECVKTGLKAVKLTPKDKSQPYIFSFGGTQSFSDMWADIYYGGPQINNHCFDRLISDAKKLINKGHEILFTGHSLGGALAQVASVLTQHNNKTDTNIYLISFAGFGGLEGLKTRKEYKKINSDDVRKVMAINMVAPADMVPRWGTQIYDNRIIPLDKCDAVTDFKKLPGRVDQHRLTNIVSYLTPKSHTVGESYENIFHSKSKNNHLERSDSSLNYYFCN